MPKKRVKTIVLVNRLPVRVDPETGELIQGPNWTQSFVGDDVQMVGWVGGAIPDELRSAVFASAEKQNLSLVDLTPEEELAYYLNVSSSTYWGTCHNREDHSAFLSPHVPSEEEWEIANRVVSRFVDAALSVLEESPDAIIWVHDFQLFMAPGMIRAKRPDAKIGFFLHIPFPENFLEQFRAMKRGTYAEAVIKSLCSADQVSFHTQLYCENFLKTVWEIFPDAQFNIGKRKLQLGERALTLFASSLGVDYEARAFVEAKSSCRKNKELARFYQFKEENSERTYLLSVDRADPSKGIVRRLLEYIFLLSRVTEPDAVLSAVALEALLSVPLEDFHDELLRIFREKTSQENHPFTYVHLISATRSGIDLYDHEWAKIQILFQVIKDYFGEKSLYEIEKIPFNLVPALHAACDIFVVSSLADGLHLGGLEFSAAHEKNPNAAVLLSKYVGAAQIFSEPAVVLYDPYIFGEGADRLLELHQKLLDLRRPLVPSMQQLQQAVLHNHNLHRWLFNQISSIQAAAEANAGKVVFTETTSYFQEIWAQLNPTMLPEAVVEVASSSRSWRFGFFSCCGGSRIVPEESALPLTVPSEESVRHPSVMLASGGSMEDDKAYPARAAFLPMVACDSGVFSADGATFLSPPSSRWLRDSTRSTESKFSSTGSSPGKTESSPDKTPPPPRKPPAFLAYG